MTICWFEIVMTSTILDSLHMQLINVNKSLNMNPSNLGDSISDPFGLDSIYQNK